MQRTSVCRQEGFGRQEGWNIHYLLSFDNEATWQWSHFQMSAVHKCRRELTLHNFCLFHSALGCQSKADSQNSTEQLDEVTETLPWKQCPWKRHTYSEKNTLYVNMGKAGHEYLIFRQRSTEDKNNVPFKWGPSSWNWGKSYSVLSDFLWSPVFLLNCIIFYLNVRTWLSGAGVGWWLLLFTASTDELGWGRLKYQTRLNWEHKRSLKEMQIQLICYTEGCFSLRYTTWRISSFQQQTGYSAHKL